MNFDRLAPHYDWLEALTAGQRLQRARTTWLDALADRRRILSVGEGHGRFAHACVASRVEAHLTCLDASAQMLARAQRRVHERASCIQWECVDLAAWIPSDKYDAVVTCFFLDCFGPEQMTEMVAKLADCATADALWIVVDFSIPANGLARWRAQLVHRLMYGFFRTLVALPARTLTPPDKALASHGFRLVGRREFEWGLVRADLWRRA